MDNLKNKLLLAPVVYATFSLSPGEDFENLNSFDIVDLIPAFLQIVLIIAAVVCLLFLLIGGIKWITSGGDKAQLESARGTVTGALVGLFIVFVSWALIKLVGGFFGVNIGADFTLPSVVPEATDG